MIRNLRQGALDPTEAGLQAPDVETLEESGLVGAGQLLIGVGPDGPGVGVGGQQGAPILVGPMLGAGCGRQLGSGGPQRGLGRRKDGMRVSISGVGLQVGDQRDDQGDRDPE